jgi:hypothetical protein
MKDYITIKEYAEKNKIVLPSQKGLEYSDLYVKIYRKYIPHTKEWETIESDGSICKRALHYYKISDLDEFFKNEYTVKS